MIELFREWVLNIVYVIVFLVFIEIIIPSDKFKKYIKFATGIIVMVVIMNPLVNTLNKQITLDDIVIQSFNEFEVSDMKLKSDDFGNFQNKQILNIYQEKLKNQIKEKILSMNGINDAVVNINIEENIKSDEFGKLKKIETIVYINENIKSNASEDIKAVNINVSNNEKNNEKVINEIKSSLSEMYELDLQNIYIKIR